MKRILVLISLTCLSVINMMAMDAYDQMRDLVKSKDYVNAGSRIVAMSFCEPRSWTRVLSS